MLLHLSQQGCGSVRVVLLLEARGRQSVETACRAPPWVRGAPFMVHNACMRLTLLGYCGSHAESGQRHISAVACNDLLSGAARFSGMGQGIEVKYTAAARLAAWSLGQAQGVHPGPAVRQHAGGAPCWK